MPAFHLYRCVLPIAALALAACQPGGRQASGPAAPQAEAADAGAPMLAAVENARAAIAAGDQVAAFNDVNLALGYAVRLQGGDSTLYPPEAAPPGYRDPSPGGGSGQAGAGGGGSGRGHHGGGRHAAAGGQATTTTAPPTAPAPPAAAPPEHHAGHAGRGGQVGRGGHGGRAALSAFDAQVKLLSAQAELQEQDAPGADADLQAVESAARAPAPASLPLIRADQSLTLAAAAVSGGRLRQLRTQLFAAQAALAAYQGAPHAADARALAATIDEAMRQPGGLGALQPAQVALWSGVVGAWT